MPMSQGAHRLLALPMSRDACSSAFGRGRESVPLGKTKPAKSKTESKRVSTFLPENKAVS